MLHGITIKLVSSSLPAWVAVYAQLSKPNQQDAIDLPELHAPTEAPEKTPAPSESQSQRVGFAVVGHLSLNQILSAFGASKYCKLTALVSGDRDKARKVAVHYGVPDTGLYDDTTYDELAEKAQRSGQLPSVSATLPCENKRRT